MAQIPLTRCQFLMPFAEIHSAVGGPTGALLAKYRLPTSLDKKADCYVPLLPAIEFAAAAQQQQGLTELGFRASQLLRFEHLSDASRARVRHAPTLLVALQQMCKWALVEDTCLQLWLEMHDDHVRICSKIAGAEGIPFMEMSHWLQNIFVIHIVRQFAGAHWSPSVIAFESPYRPGADVQAFWPNTRFMSAQKASWVEVRTGLLSLPNVSNAPSPILCDDHPEPVGDDVISVLKLSLPAYLDEGGVSITQAAEMVGLSVRSLQRQLSFAGLTYSSLLESIRFSNAMRLLRSTESKIIEIAMLSGYADPAHFSRAFRRISGCTPSAFRQHSK